jgi:hypothetical protein
LTFPDPQPGLVIRYAYLWWDQSRIGREEGEKDRPCAVILAIAGRSGAKHVLLAPITHRRPEDSACAVEIPPATKKRLGLDDAPSWVITNELNRFTWPGPDLRPLRRDTPGGIDFGLLPTTLFEKIKEQIKANAKTILSKTVNRDT